MKNSFLVLFVAAFCCMLPFAVQAVNLKDCDIVVENNEPQLVRKAAGLFSQDIERVTDVRPRVVASLNNRNNVVLTTAENRELLERVGVDASDIRGAWERFKIVTKGKRLVIVGSDPRGLAYGVFHISERIGVNPWYWWADVPVKKLDNLNYKEQFTSNSPSVKYRGIFLNDEDWGIKPWAATNFEKELNDIGPRTYGQICELLLRLKANMIAPAMHSCTGAFYSHPESKVVCDSFGIVITTSHCEPLLINTAAKTDWDLGRDGDWNYKTNPQKMIERWNERLADAACYENIYTTAMRGLHDAGLRGNLPMEERVPLIGQLIKDQRQLLENHIGKPATQIPQIFVPYKETMDIYENGLDVPEDITLVWVDDNYGYMKRVSNPQEQKRSGHAGVYYHISYLGAPHDYLWIYSTPPVLMYEELKKSYDTGADRYWLVNVGDIKPGELGIQVFLDMAWDINAFNYDNVNKRQAEFLASCFGKNKQKQFQQLIDEYLRLAWRRKPEYMGFEREWDGPQHTGLKSTDFSFQTGEAQQRLADYQAISDLAEQLSDGSAAFFELVQHPVQGAYQMNRKFLMAQLCRELFDAGNLAEAKWAAQQMEEAYDSINTLNRRYNELLGGKWRGMMTLPPGLNALYQNKPEVPQINSSTIKPVDLTPNMVNDNGFVLDIANFKTKSPDARLVDGLGYEWKVIQLGEPTQLTSSAFVEYSFPAIQTDSVSVTIHTVPFWPIYKGRSNRVAISVDGGEQQVFENRFREYSVNWKDQVLINGVSDSFSFCINQKANRHTLRIQAVDAGQMIQRILVKPMDMQ